MRIQEREENKIWQVGDVIKGDGSYFLVAQYDDDGSSYDPTRYVLVDLTNNMIEMGSSSEKLSELYRDNHESDYQKVNLKIQEV